MKKFSVFKCLLYYDAPYIAEYKGKYHIMQGGMKKDDIRKWYDTKEEAVERWNHRLCHSKFRGSAVEIDEETKIVGDGTYFTDQEYRLLLRALSREREVCEKVDKDCGEDHKLLRLMNSIEKKIKHINYHYS